MSEDPYIKWLGLPTGPRPPRPHELLGLPAGIQDREAIDRAAGERMDRLDQYALAGNPATRSQIQQLMNQVAKARTTLVRNLPKPSAVEKPSADSAPVADVPVAQAAIPLQPIAPPPSAEHAANPVPAPALTPAQRAALPPITVLPPAPVPVSTPWQERPLFWPILGSSWAMSLVLTGIIAYLIVTPDPTTPDSPAPFSSTHTPSPNTRPGSDNTPASSKEETREAQRLEQQLAEEKQRAEEQRLAEEKRQAALKRQAQELEIQRELAVLKIERRLAPYIAQRDRLQGQAQVDLLQQKLSELNGGIDVQLVPQFEDNQLVGLDLGVFTDRQNIKSANRQITDLSALIGLKLRTLNLNHLRELTTLDALKGMPLEQLEFDVASSLIDISALQGMPMKTLRFTAALFNDLEPLRGMPLENLTLIDCDKVTTTAPLKGIALKSVQIIICTNLKEITGLESMDGADASTNFFKSGITDLSPLKGLSFNQLQISGCNDLKSLNGLQGTTTNKLYLLDLQNIDDLSPLSDATITRELRIGGPKITDLTPLAGAAFKTIHIECENLESLKGLENLPNLTYVLILGETSIRRDEINRLRKANPRINVDTR